MLCETYLAGRTKKWLGGGNIRLDLIVNCLVWMIRVLCFKEADSSVEATLLGVGFGFVVGGISQIPSRKR